VARGRCQGIITNFITGNIFPQMIMMYRSSRISESNKSESPNMANHLVAEAEVSTEAYQ
jgi:hypothetical protein